MAIQFLIALLSMEVKKKKIKKKKKLKELNFKFILINIGIFYGYNFSNLTLINNIILNSQAKNYGGYYLDFLLISYHISRSRNDWVAFKSNIN